LGDFDGAVKFFDEALQQDSTNARALMNRAVALHNTGRRVESDPLWAQLLKRSTGEARFEGMCYYHMGTSLSEDKEYERAVDVLQRGLAAMDAGSTEPGYESATAVVRGRLHCALGFALGSLGRLNDAERAWQEGARVSPAHVDNVISLAHHYFNVKRYDEAVPWYERAMQLNTASMRIVTDYALCLASMGRFGDVERLHEHCLKVGNAVSAACSQHRTLAE
jgi:Flp pilus assembly protein TadD